jgi:hypothetical protein
VSLERTLLAIQRQEQSVSIGRVATLEASNADRTKTAPEKASVTAVRLGQVGRMPTKETVNAVIEEMGSWI